ncbi:hypothetical protein PGTUg99_008159 [Puccinia graminis f. sp. tritici]|uniref:Uncharacterized protein n=1 Tax=Puccinia graminis f. sp. tritici TaxID=56615 RepID=A0A5B0PJJ5_PUCGR|nr:hypothetical protein PGTUg99_008159 [Puccinia graminis f. sp. tritici]
MDHENDDPMEISDSPSDSDSSTCKATHIQSVKVVVKVTISCLLASNEIDPELLESKAELKEKRRRVKQRAKKDQDQILKIATSRPLPHPTSSLSCSVTRFIKFMMGLNNANSTLPAPPSDDEVSAWTNHIANREAQVANKLSAPSKSNGPAACVSTTGAETAPCLSRSSMNFLRAQKLGEIRNQGLALVKFTSSPDVLSDQPISFQTKRMCEKAFQLKGISRITFEWNARSLAASRWNNTTALVLIESWSSWYKTQMINPKHLEEDIQGIIERWLRTMRGIYRKQIDSKERVEARSPRGLPQHLKDRKKISERRYAAAKAIFPKNSSFTILFKDVRTVSDYEDNVNATLPRTRIIPQWRSQIFTKVAHQLDEAAKQLERDRRKRANLTNLLRRGGIKDEAGEAEDLMEAPERFPADCYNQAYLDGLTSLERSHLKPKAAIGLENFFDSVCKKTTNGHMNTDEPTVANTRASVQN